MSRFRCVTCFIDFERHDQYLRHQTVHLGNYRHNSFYCGYNGCKKILSNIHHFRFHLKNHHILQLSSHIDDNDDNIKKNENGEFKCTNKNCQNFFSAENELISHLKSHLLKSELIVCPFGKCTCVFQNQIAFKNHRSRLHSKKNNKKQLELEETYREDEVFDQNGIDVYESVFKVNLLDFYTRLETEFKVPIKVIDLISSTIDSLHRQQHNIVTSKVYHHLIEAGIDSEPSRELVQLINCYQILSRHNGELKTNYLRRKLQTSSKLYVAPVKVALETVKVNRKDVTTKYFYYVPIQKTLQAIFSSKHMTSVIRDCDKYQEEEDVISDYCSGLAYKSNNFFKNHKDSLEFLLFQDAFQTVNPLGSARTKYKTIAVYMCLGNLPPYLRTHIDNVLLVALINEKWFDHEKVVGRIVQDFKDLESKGIELRPGEMTKGGIVHMCGDNLGNHMIGGYQESFSKNIKYICRYCEIKNEDLDYTPDNVDEFLKIFPKYAPLRTPESYDQCVKEMLDANRRVTNVKGIKFNSKLNELESFHVCNPGLAPCFGHDFTEGVVAYDLLLYIKHLVEESWFTYQELNDSISNFPFSQYDSRDKPKPCINKKLNKIVGSAWEVRCLLRFFPLIVRNIRELKDPDCDVWIAVELLVELGDIACSPEINKTYLPYLQSKTEEYISRRIKLFPNVRTKPKHHYFGHSALLIFLFGPLLTVWSLRFESKHTFFRGVIRTSRNFVNIYYTMSVKHELYQGFLRKGYISFIELKLFNEKDFVMVHYSEKIQLAIRKLNIGSSLLECNKIVFRGTEFQCGDIVIVKSIVYHEELDAGLIRFMLIDSDNSAYVLIEKVKCTFIFAYQCYEVKKLNESSHECIRVKDLQHLPLKEYEIEGRQLVKLKHEIVGNPIF